MNVEMDGDGLPNQRLFDDIPKPWWNYTLLIWFRLSHQHLDRVKLGKTTSPSPKSRRMQARFSGSTRYIVGPLKDIFEIIDFPRFSMGQ